MVTLVEQWNKLEAEIQSLKKQIEELQKAKAALEEGMEHLYYFQGFYLYAGLGYISDSFEECLEKILKEHPNFEHNGYQVFPAGNRIGDKVAGIIKDITPISPNWEEIKALKVFRANSLLRP